MKKNFLIDLLIFSTLFLILGFFTTKLKLYLDDYTFLFPAIYKNFGVHFKNYLTDFGLSRPISLIYYYLIFSIYIHSSSLAHLIPLVVTLFSAYLLIKVIKNQGLSTNRAFFSGILLVCIPFITESYSWLSANSSVFVVLIFFIQIYIIEKNIFKKNVLEIVSLLQIVSVFLYETAILMPFSLAYLIYAKGREKNKFKLILYSSSSLFIYMLSKFIFRPQFEVRSRLISLPEAVNNWRSSLSGLQNLFSSLYIENFWVKEILNGLQVIQNYPLITFLMLFLFILILFKVFLKYEDILITKPTTPITIFWFLCVIFSLIPLTWQKNYLPFRTLVLPSITISVFLNIYFNRQSFLLKNRLMNNINICLKILFTLFIVTLLTIQISMLTRYKNQNAIDQKITTEINDKLEKLGFEHPYRSNLYLKNMQKNNISQLVYGDYLFTNYDYYWVAEALLDLNSGSFSKVAIEFPNNGDYTSSVNRQDFLKMRPLTIMKFTDNQSCLKEKCLKIESVYKEPY